MKKQIINTIKNMVSSAEREFKERKISLSELNFNSVSDMLSSMDNIMLDGGEFRCERFCDLTHEVALNFGGLESEGFEDVKWECIKLAYKVLKKKYEAEYIKEPFTAEELLIVADENGLVEGDFLISLSNVIYNNEDIKEFLDLINNAIAGCLVMKELDYEMIHYIPKTSNAIFKVSGDISDKIDELEEESFSFLDKYEDEDDDYGFETALIYKDKEIL